MSRLQKILLLILVVTLATLNTGCPEEETTDDEPDELYHVGTWAGTVVVDARLVMLDGPYYWNSVWKLEADIRLDEYQDGSLVGNITGDFFQWNQHNESILSFEEIKTGQWDVYTMFGLDVRGHVDDNGYALIVDELPTSLPDPNKPADTIDFWDFLYPSRIEGEWPVDDETRIMQGWSERPQGEDYRKTSILSTFREANIRYTWSVRKL